MLQAGRTGMLAVSSSAPFFLPLPSSAYDIALVLIFEWAQAFFIAPTRKAIGHSKNLWNWAKCRQIKEWEQKSYICQVKLGAKWLWSCWNGRGILPCWTSHEKTARSSASSSQGLCESAQVVCSLQYGSGGKKNNNGPENPEEIKMLIIEPLYCKAVFSPKGKMLTSSSGQRE